MGKDRLNGRNQHAIENCIFKIINERRACNQLAQPGEEDLLDLLLREDVYKGDDLKLCYDLRMICLAGTETINVSTANLIYFLTMHKHF
jgi:cytochrome P450